MKNIPLAINKSIVLVMLCLCALGLQAQTVTKTFRNAALSDVLAEISGRPIIPLLTVLTI